MLIHKGTKQMICHTQFSRRLRALLIHKGTKHGRMQIYVADGLRALLIHKGTKLLRELMIHRQLFESFVNS